MDWRQWKLKEKRQEVNLEEVEIKIMRFLLGMTNMDGIRNEYIRRTAQAEQSGDKV